MLAAGHAINALPQTATANINCRIFPGISVTEVEAKLKEVIGNNEIEIRLTYKPKSAPASPLREDVIDAVTKAVKKLNGDMPIIPYMSTGATDGRALRSAGIPT